MHPAATLKGPPLKLPNSMGYPVAGGEHGLVQTMSMLIVLYPAVGATQNWPFQLTPLHGLGLHAVRTV